jgi:predicted NodU family carbamoyl transferase
MIILGINETTHDASVSLLRNGELVFAAHAERFSKQKNDWFTNDELIDCALQYGKPDRIAYYENRWLKKSRIFLISFILKYGILISFILLIRQYLFFISSFFKRYFYLILNNKKKHLIYKFRFQGLFSSYLNKKSYFRII